MAKATILLHGGGSTTPEAIKAFIQASGGPDAPIVVLGQVGENPADKAQRSVEWLRENGARNVQGAGQRGPGDPDFATLAALVEKAQGVWIPGGDQNRLTAAFQGTSIPAAIRAVAERGGAVGGTSAGASLMGEWMPTGDGDRTVMALNAVVTAPGLNLLPGFLVDSHFFVRERTQRLLNMTASHPERAGIGVDELAWATVSGGHLTVQAGQVMLIRCIGHSNRDSEKRLGVRAARLRILLPGESVALRDWRSR